MVIEGLGPLLDLNLLCPKSFHPILNTLGDILTPKGNFRIIDPSNTVKQYIATAVNIIQQLPNNLIVARLNLEQANAPQIQAIDAKTLFNAGNNATQI
jgi:hypothetical protein